MLEKEEFEKKYETNHSQRREESFLDTVSEEDFEIFTKSEILTGIDDRTARINKFYQIGQNKGKTYNTTKMRFINEFKKYIDNKLAEGKSDEVFDRLWKSSKNGSFNHLKYLFDRVAGQMTEEISVKSEETITFTLEPDKIIGKKEDKND